jgi:hypothetical protein
MNTISEQGRSAADRDDGGPAFPYLTASETDREVTTHEGEHGMSLRDYFAAKSMGMGWKTFDEGYSPEELTPDNIAKFAYQMADAMLKARAA